MTKKFVSWTLIVCISEGGFLKKCLAKIAVPNCAEYPFGRVNHFGNGAGIEGIGYDMSLTNFPSGKNK